MVLGPTFLSLPPYLSERAGIWKLSMLWQEATSGPHLGEHSQGTALWQHVQRYRHQVHCFCFGKFQTMQLQKPLEYLFLMSNIQLLWRGELQDSSSIIFRRLIKVHFNFIQFDGKRIRKSLTTSEKADQQSSWCRPALTQLPSPTGKFSSVWERSFTF